MRSRFAVFVSIIQTIIFLGHLFLYFTWASFWPAVTASAWMKLLLALLSVSFVSASFLAWRSHGFFARVLYGGSAVWLGISSYFLWASVLCWLIYGIVDLARLPVRPAQIADLLFAAAVLISIYGLLNAQLVRVKRMTVTLANLPAQWRGRTAALISDLHLGHVRNRRFLERVIGKVNSLRPEALFIAGDLYDGTSASLKRLTQPWSRLSVPLGAYYIAGNHEEFFDHTKYLESVASAGIRVVNNEKVEVDGLQLVGVHYRDAIDPAHYRAILCRAGIDRARASVLLLHAPVQLPISEAHGISLQLSGHTHGGQFFPYTMIAKRVWGDFIYGLKRLGNMQVYTSYGAGTWGPPMRVGTRPEIVLITFQ